MPKYENETKLCPFCSEKLVKVLPCDVSLDRPPPEPFEAFVDIGLWFIPECPKFFR